MRQCNLVERCLRENREVLFGIWLPAQREDPNRANHMKTRLTNEQCSMPSGISCRCTIQVRFRGFASVFPMLRLEASHEEGLDTCYQREVVHGGSHQKAKWLQYKLEICGYSFDL